MNMRWLIVRDYPEVLAIDAAGYGPEAMTRAALAMLMRQRDVIGVVVEEGETILGYALFRRERHQIEAISLAVHPAHRRRGVGTRLVRRLKALCHPEGPRRRLRVVCDLGQLAGCEFLKRAGFYGVLQSDGGTVAFHWLAKAEQPVAV